MTWSTGIPSLLGSPRDPIDERQIGGAPQLRYNLQATFSGTCEGRANADDLDRARPLSIAYL